MLQIGTKVVAKSEVEINFVEEAMNMYERAISLSKEVSIIYSLFCVSIILNYIILYYIQYL